MFALRLLAYRLVKPMFWPVSRAVAIPRPTLFVGAGAALRLCGAIGQFGFKRVMIVTDAVLVKLGLVEPLRLALQEQGIDVAVHDGITPDPTYPVLQAGYEAVRTHRSDAILAIGGGSAIDAAKVIGLDLVKHSEPIVLIGIPDAKINMTRLRGRALRGEPVCVLGSGDPMFYGVGASLARQLPTRELNVIPSPSSCSLASTATAT